MSLGLLIGIHARALLQLEYLEQNKKKAEKVPLWVPKIILGAQEHPETQINPPLRGLVSLRLAAQTPFQVGPLNLCFPSNWT